MDDLPGVDAGALVRLGITPDVAAECMLQLPASSSLVGFVRQLMHAPDAMRPMVVEFVTTYVQDFALAKQKLMQAERGKELAERERDQVDAARAQLAVKMKLQVLMTFEATGGSSSASYLTSPRMQDAYKHPSELTTVDEISEAGVTGAEEAADPEEEAAIEEAAATEAAATEAAAGEATAESEEAGVSRWKEHLIRVEDMLSAYQDKYLAPVAAASAVLDQVMKYPSSTTLMRDLPGRGEEYGYAPRIDPGTVHYRFANLLAVLKCACSDMGCPEYQDNWRVLYEMPWAKSKPDASLMAMNERKSEHALKDVALSACVPIELKGNMPLSRPSGGGRKSTKKNAPDPEKLLQETLEKCWHERYEAPPAPTGGETKVDPAMLLKMRWKATAQAVAYAAQRVQAFVNAELYLPRARWFAVATTGEAIRIVCVQLAPAAVSAGAGGAATNARADLDVTVFMTPWQPLV
ncbi:MAG: hypothetical protein EOO65_02850, partial [Methanosarcinales archaeon]